MGQDRSSVSCSDEGAAALLAAAPEPLPSISGAGWGAAVARLVRRLEALERRMAVVERQLAPDVRELVEAVAASVVTHAGRIEDLRRRVGTLETVKEPE